MLSDADLSAILDLLRAELDARGLRRIPTDITEKRRRAAQARWSKQREVAAHDAHAMQSASPVNGKKRNGSHAHALQKVIGDGDIVCAVQSLHGEVEVRQSFIMELIEAYPDVMVAQELDRARLWVQANPAKRKANVRRFLTNWVARKQG